MHWLAVTFIALIAARAAAQLWLVRRQIAAVSRHRSNVPAAFTGDIASADHAKASDYAVLRLRGATVAEIARAGVLLILTLGGALASVDAAWRATGLHSPWLGAAVVLSVLALLRLADLPFSIWRTFHLETRFGFNRSSARLFAADLAKRAAVGTAVAAPLAAAVLVLMERGGAVWWLLAWLAWVCVTLALAWAWPRVVAPLFNRFTPLADTALEARIQRLLERCDFPASRVFVMDGSRRSAHGNAYFTGVGRHKRVVLFDTLLETLGAAEVEAVLAHELGHSRLRHSPRRFAAGAVLALAGFAMLAWITNDADLQRALGVQQPSAHAALTLCLLAAPLVLFFLRPLIAWRSRRDEREADDFALRFTHARHLADALVTIYRSNAASLVSDPVFSAFYDTHPPPVARIARLREQEAQAGAEASHERSPCLESAAARTPPSARAHAHHLAEHPAEVRLIGEPAIERDLRERRLRRQH